jgi:hypothetical protein
MPHSVNVLICLGAFAVAILAGRLAIRGWRSCHQAVGITRALISFSGLYVAMTQLAVVIEFKLHNDWYVGAVAVVVAALLALLIYDTGMEEC